MQKRLLILSGTTTASGERSCEYRDRCRPEDSDYAVKKCKDYIREKFDTERQLFFLEIVEEWVPLECEAQ